MAVVQLLPSHLVEKMTLWGLKTDVGSVKPNQYMSKSIGNGANDNAVALLGNLRWLKDGKAGPQLNVIVGAERLDILVKGQGHPDDFVKVMNFIVRNKEQLKAIKMSVVHRENDDSGKNAKVVTDRPSDSVYNQYFVGRSDADALQKMVADKIFGWDCIGFVANYMIYIGLWSQYLGYPIDSWSGVFPTRVLSPADVKTLSIMIWPGSHIAIIDRVWESDAGTVTVDVCQSSSGGPKCNVKVKLTKSGDGFQISGGDPPMPVAGRCLVWRKPDLSFVTG